MQPFAEAPEDRAAQVVPTVRPEAPWRIVDVEALSDFRLRVRFNDGMEGCIELRAFVESPAAGVFAALRDEKLFRGVRIAMGAVTWPGDLDLAPDAMYREIATHGTWTVA